MFFKFFVRSFVIIRQKNTSKSFSYCRLFTKNVTLEKTKKGSIALFLRKHGKSKNSFVKKDCKSDKCYIITNVELSLIIKFGYYTSVKISEKNIGSIWIANAKKQ